MHKKSPKAKMVMAQQGKSKIMLEVDESFWAPQGVQCLQTA